MTDPVPRCYKVAFLNLWPEGGMKHYADSVVHALRPAADVFYIRNYESRGGGEGLAVRIDVNPLQPANLFKTVRIWRALRHEKPDVIHLNNEQPVLLPLYPFFTFANSVITLHDAGAHDGERLARRWFYALHVLFVFLFIRKVIVHSEAIRAALPSLLRCKRVSVVPHVNYDFWGSQDSPLPSADDPFTLLFFGRILAYKGLGVLLEAFASLDPKRFRLVIAGAGEMPSVSAPNIEVHNRFIPDEEMPELFPRCHAVALPYLSASQSGVVHMAFAFGRPVIATRVGALPDVVRDGVNGLLVAAGSSAEFADAIERLSDREMHRRMCENIRQQSVSSDESIREKLLAIYRE